MPRHHVNGRHVYPSLRVVIMSIITPERRDDTIDSTSSTYKNVHSGLHEFACLTEREFSHVGPYSRRHVSRFWFLVAKTYYHKRVRIRVLWIVTTLQAMFAQIFCRTHFQEKVTQHNNRGAKVFITLSRSDYSKYRKSLHSFVILAHHILPLWLSSRGQVNAVPQIKYAKSTY